MNWIATNIFAIVPLLVLLGMGIGYLIRRQMSGQAHVEDQEGLERAVRLNSLLNSEGMTLAEAKEIREKFRNSRNDMTKAEAQAIVEKQAQAEQRDVEVYWKPGDPVPFEHTNAGMKMKAKAKLNALEAEVEYAIIEFGHECSPARKTALDESQAAWEAYRDAEGKLAGLLWEGGSGAPLLNVSRMMELTEERLKDIRLAQAESSL